MCCVVIKLTGVCWEKLIHGSVRQTGPGRKDVLPHLKATVNVKRVRPPVTRTFETGKGLALTTRVTFLVVHVCLINTTNDLLICVFLFVTPVS